MTFSAKAHEQADGPSDSALQEAAQRLFEGGLVAFPTETVYGLGADAENAQAVAKIYAAKQRPSNHPLIVHLAPNADITHWVSHVPPQAQALIDTFWPGPLTLILTRASRIPPAVSGGQSTIGVRCPSHPVAQALLTRFAELKPGGQGGVAAPSANKFGQVSPTRAQHVRSEFPELTHDRLVVLDGGPSNVGIESTIVDVSEPAMVPVLLRPGHITADQLAHVLGVTPAQPHAASPQVSGSLKAHYAPRTPLYVVPSDGMGDVFAQYTLAGAGRPPGGASPAGGRFAAALVFELPPDGGFEGVSYYQCDPTPDGYASKLYDTLRRLDGRGYAALVLEQPPRTEEWRAVNDRISRAAAAFSL